jgi:hypothetical protein
VAEPRSKTAAVIGLLADRAPGLLRCRLRTLIFLPAPMPWLVSATFAEVFTLCASTTAAVGSLLRPCARRILSRNRSWTCWVVPSASHFA